MLEENMKRKNIINKLIKVMKWNHKTCSTKTKEDKKIKTEKRKKQNKEPDGANF